MDNNNLPTVSVIGKLVASHLSNNLPSDDVQKLINEFDKSLNWKLLYKTLEATVEEFILINNGNPQVNSFRDKMLNNLSDVVKLLIK